MDRVEIDDAEVRRLVPVVMDLIRDDLNRPDLQRGVMATAIANEDPPKLIAVQSFVGRWFARSLANYVNEMGELRRQNVELESAGAHTYVQDVCTPEEILEQLQAAILEQRAD